MPYRIPQGRGDRTGSLEHTTLFLQPPLHTLILCVCIMYTYRSICFGKDAVYIRLSCGRRTSELWKHWKSMSEREVFHSMPCGRSLGYWQRFTCNCPRVALYCLCIVPRMEGAVSQHVAIAKPSSWLVGAERWVSVLWCIQRFLFKLRVFLGSVLIFCNSEALPSMVESHSPSSFIWKERTMLNCSLPQNIF